jgi:NAD(P)-dependent dehydrogenase (short-subunit alcohol dehydrogenase family)
LIIGGSRGVGELTAKILAAGGAQVVITYATGRHDAEAVAHEINAWGGTCEVLEYNVLKPPGDQLSKLKHILSHLYYFATPRIAVPKRTTFQPSALKSLIVITSTDFTRSVWL